jgi:hypothetical protein
LLFTGAAGQHSSFCSMTSTSLTGRWKLWRNVRFYCLGVDYGRCICEVVHRIRPLFF